MNVETVIKWFKKTGLVKEECYVKGCHVREIEPITIKAFDPIDHQDTEAKLCPEHYAWAEERNAFAEHMYDELREARKEIGMDNIDRIQELTIPQGEIRKDILDGSVKESGERYISLEEAIEP